MPRGKIRGKRPRSYNSGDKSGLYDVMEQYDQQANSEWTNFPGEVESSPAVNAAQIRNFTTNDGNYYINPGGSENTYQVYVNFSNAPSGKGYVLVGRGRNSSNWWGSAGVNQTTLVSGQLGSNTVATLPNSWINELTGGWATTKMLVNRTLYGDSWYFTGSSTADFSWSYFNSRPSSVSANHQRYPNQWKSGTLSQSGTGSYWTDTNTSGASGNDCNRSFTWTWSSHGGQQGWSHGSGCVPTGSYQAGSEAHAIDRVNIYIEC